MQPACAPAGLSVVRRWLCTEPRPSVYRREISLGLPAISLNTPQQSMLSWSRRSMRSWCFRSASYVAMHDVLQAPGQGNPPLSRTVILILIVKMIMSPTLRAMGQSTVRRVGQAEGQPTFTLDRKFWKSKRSMTASTRLAPSRSTCRERFFYLGNIFSVPRLQQLPTPTVIRRWDTHTRLVEASLNSQPTHEPWRRAEDTKYVFPEYKGTTEMQ